MRIVYVWIMVLFLCLTIALTWYVTTPIVRKIIGVTGDVMTDIGSNSTQLTQTYTLLDYITLWWGPVLVIVIVFLWGVVSSQMKDVESDLYG